MKKASLLLLLLSAIISFSLPRSLFAEMVGTEVSGGGQENYLTEGLAEEEEVTVKDPLEPMNRAFFHFNDKVYFWVLKPVAKGYGKVLPQKARVGVRNFFTNITTPIRLVSCLLQGKFHSAGTETARFGINTTVGVLGFGDPAFKKYKIEIVSEDFGQTLGLYGLGPSIYFDWPILGPSNVRDTVGTVVDFFLNPVNYLVPPPADIGVYAFDRVNDTSLRIGEYEDFKRAAIDPYVSLRQAYMQYRQAQVEK